MKKSKWKEKIQAGLIRMEQTGKKVNTIEGKRDGSKSSNQENKKRKITLDNTEKDDNGAVKEVEYWDEIEKMVGRQKNFIINPLYLNKEAKFGALERAVIVDWLVDVQVHFQLQEQTLYIAVSIFDRYASKRRCTRETAQLIAVTAMAIACKYEEVNPPSMTELVDLCDEACILSEMEEMEWDILEVLDYRLSAPTVWYYVQYLLYTRRLLDSKVCNVAYWLAEETLLSNALLAVDPFKIAVSVVQMALEVAGKQERRLKAKGLFSKDDIVLIATTMVQERRIIRPKLDSIKKKYSLDHYGQIAQSKYIIDEGTVKQWQSRCEVV